MHTWQTPAVYLSKVDSLGFLKPLIKFHFDSTQGLSLAGPSTRSSRLVPLILSNNLASKTGRWWKVLISRLPSMFISSLWFTNGGFERLWYSQPTIGIFQRKKKNTHSRDPIVFHCPLEMTAWSPHHFLALLLYTVFYLLIKYKKKTKIWKKPRQNWLEFCFGSHASISPNYFSALSVHFAFRLGR